MREHDMTALTAAELDAARRELAASPPARRSASAPETLVDARMIAVAVTQRCPAGRAIASAGPGGAGRAGT
jgi:hypothetical protein